MSWGQQGQGTWGQQPQSGWGQQPQTAWGPQQGLNQGFSQPSLGWTLIIQKTFDIVPGVINLVGVIPDTANQVKLFIENQSGYHQTDLHRIVVTLNTDKDIAKTVIHPYPQNGWTVNSENLSLYLGQKAINVKFDGNQSPFSNGGGILKLSVLGYR